MAANVVDFDQVRLRIAALRKPELLECLERLGMRKSGNKPELQQRLLDIFNDSYHLNGHGPPRDAWRLVAAQSIIFDVYRKLVSGNGNSGGSGANGGYGSSSGGNGAEDVKPRGGGGGGPPPTSGSAAATAGAPCGGGSDAPYTNGITSVAATADALLAGAMNAFIRERAVGGGSVAATAPTIRCSCGFSSDRQPQVQCLGCLVWQHRRCVGLDAHGAASKPAGGGEFFCEICRAKRADPFWEVEDAGITSVIRLSSTGKQAAVNGAMQQIRSADRTFTLAPQQMQKLKSRQGEHQLQLACLQLGDSVPFRLHWPLGADLRINSVQYRVYSRNSGQKLGANGRDEPANIGQLWSSAAGGRFHVTMQCTDSSVYVMVVLLAKRRSSEDVQKLMAPQLSVRDAVERVRQQLGRDDDDELQTGATVVSLRCPILGGRMLTPARFAEVRGLACFDLGAFLDSAARTRKWQCPISMTHSTVHSLQIDTYMQRIIAALSDCPSVMEVEVEADGSWRPAGWRDRFYSVQEDNPLAAAAGRAGGAAADSSDGEETDEEEELRRAAAAVASGATAAAASGAGAAAGQKRKRQPSPDVIDLLSSDEDDGVVDRGGGVVPNCIGLQTGGVPPPSNAGPSIGLSRGTGTGAGTAAPSPPQPAAATTAAAGSGATADTSVMQQQQAPLRITLPNRRMVATNITSNRPVQPQPQHHPHLHQGPQPAPGSGPPQQPQQQQPSLPPQAAAGSAVAAAGAAVLATHRQHLEQRGGGSLSRQHLHPHHTSTNAAAGGTAAAAAAHGPSPSQQQPTHQMLRVTASAPQLPQTQAPQQSSSPAVAAAAGTGGMAAGIGSGGGGGGGVSHRQLVNAAGCTTIRIRTAAAAGPSGVQLDGQVPPPPPGVPAITPYQPQGRPPLAPAAAASAAGGASATWPPPHVGSAAGENPHPSQPFSFPPGPSQQPPPQQQQQQQASRVAPVNWQQQPHHHQHHLQSQSQPQSQLQYQAPLPSQQQQQQQQQQAYLQTTLAARQYLKQLQQQQQQQQQEQQQQQRAGGTTMVSPFSSGANTNANPNSNVGGSQARATQPNAGAAGGAAAALQYECIDLLDDSGDES